MEGRRNRTRIGSSLYLKGDLVADEEVWIAGRFTGNIAASGTVRVEPDGVVKGDITAANLILEGSVEGSVTIAGRFDLRPPGRMLGDVKASVVLIAENTFLRGKVLATKRISTQIPSLRRRIRAARPAADESRIRSHAGPG